MQSRKGPPVLDPPVSWPLALREGRHAGPTVVKVPAAPSTGMGITQMVHTPWGVVGWGVWAHVLSVPRTLPRCCLPSSVTKLGPDRDSPESLLPGLDQETELEGATQISDALLWRSLSTLSPVPGAQMYGGGGVSSQ